MGKRYGHNSPEKLCHKLYGATVFSKLDAKAGYWSIRLDNQSQYLTTFRTPFGRYRFLRLPFGLSVSQDIFQERMDIIMEQCHGTLNIADDVAVYGKNVQEHDKNLINLMDVARKHGLVFNSKKCALKQSQIEFYGMIYSASGMKPDPKKVEDLKLCRIPTAKQSFKNS